MPDFSPLASPLPALLGGGLIGLSASILLLFNGKVAGISGIFGGLLIQRAGDVAWRAAFLAGLLAGGAALVVLYPQAFPAVTSRPLWVIAAAGLFVGYGTRLGDGCTSGHGVCGLSRFSTRSLVATLTFMLTGGLTVLVTRHLLGGAR